MAARPSRGPASRKTSPLVRGEAALRRGDRRGVVCLDEIRSTPLITLRPAAGAVYLVGGAASPLGGDEASLTIDVEDGATISVRSVAAAVARRGQSPPPAASR